ncbi:hypothetical protein [Halalkalibacter akibai]|nr:hypothetical protein [Halalkalibacter akibai]
MSKAMDEIMGHLHNVDINKMEEYIQGDALLDEFFIIEEAAPYLSGCIISLKTTNFSDLDVNDIVILQENNCLSINNNEHLFDFDE